MFVALVDSCDWPPQTSDLEFHGQPARIRSSCNSLQSTKPSRRPPSSTSTSTIDTGQEPPSQFTLSSIANALSTLVSSPHLVSTSLAALLILAVATSVYMQRAAVRAVLTARRAPFLFRQPARLKLLANGTTPARHASTTTGSTTQTAFNAAYLRSFTIALVSSLVLSGAWFAYKDTHQLLLTPLSLTAAPSSNGDRRFSSSSPDASEKVRRILAVDNDQLYTGTITGDQPLSKDPVDERGGRKVLEMLSPEEATIKLRRSEESYLVGRDRGVYRYDVVQVPSNDPIEDDHAERIIEVPTSVSSSSSSTSSGAASSDWMFWGVFDGHSGWTTSAKLRNVLIGFVARELNATHKESALPSPASIDAAIKKGFLRLDHEIIHESVDRVLKNPTKSAAAEILAPALSGSCALLAFYDSNTHLLRVACTGDSRAVLGRRSDNGKWTATPLSVDQTGSNEDEAKRMRAEHPGEEQTVIRNGRVLGGLEPSRAFGDAFYKWSMDTQLTIKNKFFGRSPSKLLKSPPYVTAEPVVTTTRILPEKGDFLVMATDGLWEMLSNEEVVGLVGRWLEDQRSAAISAPKSSSWFGWFGGVSASEPYLPVENGHVDDHGGQRQPIRQRQWGITAKENERFVSEDANCATHLVRNALGGKDKDMVCALLTLPSPYSRRYRDDLTVEVIFFGEGDRSGNVVVNEPATSLNKKQS